MFKKQVQNNKSNYELQIESEKAKIECEILQFKIKQLKEKNDILSGELSEANNWDITHLKEDNERLKKVISDLKFKIENNTSTIELETENKKMKAEIDIQMSENKYLKELLDTYRNMPDVKNVIDNLSSLAVPHIDEIKEFAKIINESEITKLYSSIQDNNNIVKEIRGRLYDMSQGMRGYR